MNIFKRSILTIALLVGFSVAASAQKDKDADKKPPPKPPPPIIVVQPKPTPDKPKDGKKPNSMSFYWREEN